MRQLAPTILLAAALASAPPSTAQDAEEYDPGFGDRFLQTHTPTVNEKGLLEAIFQHRFLQPVIRAGGNNLGGLDSGANIGLGVVYVPLKGLSVEAYRASTNADYEFALKYTFLRPTAKLPVGIGVRSGIDWVTKAEVEEKVGFFGQVLVSATLGSRVTIAAAPTYVSNTLQFENVWNVPLILQLNLGKKWYATGEWVFANADLERSVGQWSFAVEKSLWRHRFGVWIGNSSGLTVDQRMAGDFGGGVTDSNIRLGFNIIRQFDIAVQ